MGSAQDEMRALILQPFPSESLPNGLTREQKLTYLAFSLEQHAEVTKDKIRLNALCEASYASKEPTKGSPFRPSQTKLRPTAFREAARQSWKRGTPPPVVKQSRRAQPNFHLQQDANSHVAIAKRAIARLNEFDKTMKPAIDAVNFAKDGKDVGFEHAVTSGSARLIDEQNAVDASRDPRLTSRRV